MHVEGNIKAVPMVVCVGVIRTRSEGSRTNKHILIQTCSVICVFCATLSQGAERAERGADEDEGGWTSSSSTNSHRYASRVIDTHAGKVRL